MMTQCKTLRQPIRLHPWLFRMSPAGADEKIPSP